MDFEAHLHHLHAESARFLDAARRTSPGQRVPTCPDWNADDLLWHLGGEVQWFWASVAELELRDLHQVIDLPEIERPADRDGLLRLFTEHSARLHRVLIETEPQERRWMWIADPNLHTIAYIARRQAHEALIHRIDAEATLGSGRTPIDRCLAVDGVDEAIVLMHGNHPAWGSFTPAATQARFQAVDTGDTWTVSLGRFAGTDRGGQDVDVDSWEPAEPVDEPAATISGKAADLDLWLWGRPCANPPVLQGDSAALAIVQEIIGEGVD